MNKLEKLSGDAIRVCIDGYQDHVLRGRLQSAAWEGEMPFISLMEFFKTVEQVLDELLPPQAFTEMRRFGPPDRGDIVGGKRSYSEPGELATFCVHILFRQNASWQGIVRWSEGGQEIHFRSALELALLIDSALQRDCGV